MVVVPLTKDEKETGGAPPTEGAKTANPNWLRYAAAGTLAASGALLLTGNKRAALVTAASGTALALLDQKEIVQVWWDRLPGFLEEMQGMLNRAQFAVEDLSSQSVKLRKALGK